MIGATFERVFSSDLCKSSTIEKLLTHYKYISRRNSIFLPQRTIYNLKLFSPLKLPYARHQYMVDLEVWTFRTLAATPDRNMPLINGQKFSWY